MGVHDWNDIRGLKGRILITLDQGAQFRIVDASSSAIEIKNSKGNIRPIKRDEIEGAMRELQDSGTLSRDEIQANHSPYNSAYVAAILSGLPGVTHSRSPIVLRYNDPS